MKAHIPLTVALLAFTNPVTTALSIPHPEEAAEAEKVSVLTSTARLSALSKFISQEIKPHGPSQDPPCTLQNLSFRREYGSLSTCERADYVRSVQCLRSLPPRTLSNVSTGARSRFDDFTVTHIQRTLDIHFTGNFMPWHRWFVFQFEKALREECGYGGFLPYWDWPLYQHAPQESPLFDGSETSLGGGGEWVSHEGPVIVSPDGESEVQLPRGLGGGYVTTGPFANMTIPLGPVGGLRGVPPGPDGGLGFNPRRLKRDIGPALNERYANYSTVLSKWLMGSNRRNEQKLTAARLAYQAKHCGIPPALRGRSIHRRNRPARRHSLRLA